MLVFPVSITISTIILYSLYLLLLLLLLKLLPIIILSYVRSMYKLSSR